MQMDFSKAFNGLNVDMYFLEAVIRKEGRQYCGSSNL